MNSQKKQSPRCLTSTTNVLHILIIIRHGNILISHKCNAICLSPWLYQILSGHYSTPPTSLDIIWCMMCNSFFTNILWINIVTNIWLFTRASRKEGRKGWWRQWKVRSSGVWASKHHWGNNSFEMSIQKSSNYFTTPNDIQFKSSGFSLRNKPLGVGGSPGHRSLWGIQTTILGWLG